MVSIFKLSLAVVITTTLFGCTVSNSLSTQTSTDGSYTVKTIGNNPKLTTEVMIERISMATVGDLKKVSLSIKDRWFMSKNFGGVLKSMLTLNEAIIDVKEG